MDLGDLLGNGKPQSRSSRGAVACFGDAKERLKQTRQRLGRHTGPLISDCETGRGGRVSTATRASSTAVCGGVYRMAFRTPRSMWSSPMRTIAKSWATPACYAVVSKTSFGTPSGTHRRRPPLSWPSIAVETLPPRPVSQSEIRGPACRPKRCRVCLSRSFASPKHATAPRRIGTGAFHCPEGRQGRWGTISARNLDNGGLIVELRLPIRKSLMI